MKALNIHGPTCLEGCVNIQGSKNAALPMMAAAVMNGGMTVLENCPDILDIRNSVDILNSIGCSAVYKNHTLVVDSSGEIKHYISKELMEKLRSSFLFTGAILSRCGKVEVSFPGGCNIGARPVDIHLDAFKKLGVNVCEEECSIRCDFKKIRPCDVNLKFPSVGATENIMLLCARSNGITRILNAACEPEIIDLQNMLNSMGADVSGAGTPIIKISGAKKLCDAKHKIMPDRIVVATYLTSLACCSGKLELKGTAANHLSPYIALLRQLGMKIHIYNDKIIAIKDKRLQGSIIARTKPYPGFATDMQSLVMAAMCFCNGIGVVQENIFENRFKLAEILSKMGADINVSGRSASIRGVKKLDGINAKACDLRSGAALMAAMLAAHGDSRLYNIHYIDRGYENFSENLISLGAKIERIE